MFILWSQLRAYHVPIMSLQEQGIFQVHSQSSQWVFRYVLPGKYRCANRRPRLDLAAHSAVPTFQSLGWGSSAAHFPKLQQQGFSVWQHTSRMQLSLGAVYWVSTSWSQMEMEWGEALFGVRNKAVCLRPPRREVLHWELAENGEGPSELRLSSEKEAWLRRIRTEGREVLKSWRMTLCLGQSWKKNQNSHSEHPHCL